VVIKRQSIKEIKQAVVLAAAAAGQVRAGRCILAKR
jgi:hypothetical protein